MKIRTEKSGFTLVEMLVATAIFTSVMLVATTALLSIINVNKQTQQIKSVVDNVTFALDSISRGARIGTNYTCSLTGQSFIGDCVGGGQYFQFINPDGSTSTYRFMPSASVSLGQGNIQFCTKTSCATGDWQSMTAPTSTVNITNMAFYVIGVNNQKNATISLRTQPRVIITVDGTISGNHAETVDFTLQTTASERTRLSTN